MVWPCPGSTVEIHPPGSSKIKYNLYFKGHEVISFLYNIFYLFILLTYICLPTCLNSVFLMQIIVISKRGLWSKM